MKLVAGHSFYLFIVVGIQGANNNASLSRGHHDLPGRNGEAERESGELAVHVSCSLSCYCVRNWIIEPRELCELTSKLEQQRPVVHGECR